MKPTLTTNNSDAAVNSAAQQQVPETSTAPQTPTPVDLRLNGQRSYEAAAGDHGLGTSAQSADTTGESATSSTMPSLPTPQAMAPLPRTRAQWLRNRFFQQAEQGAAATPSAPSTSFEGASSSTSTTLPIQPLPESLPEPLPPAPTASIRPALLPPWPQPPAPRMPSGALARLNYLIQKERSETYPAAPTRPAFPTAPAKPALAPKPMLPAVPSPAVPRPLLPRPAPSALPSGALAYFNRLIQQERAGQRQPLQPSPAPTAPDLSDIYPPPPPPEPEGLWIEGCTDSSSDTDSDTDSFAAGPSTSGDRRPIQGSTTSSDSEGVFTEDTQERMLNSFAAQLAALDTSSSSDDPIDSAPETSDGVAESSDSETEGAAAPKPSKLTKPARTLETALQNQEELHRQLDPNNSRGFLYKALQKHHKYITPDEYGEIAAQFYTTLDDVRAFDKKAMRQRLYTFMTQYESRTRRLVGNTLNYLNEQGVPADGPIGMGDFERIATMPTVLATQQTTLESLEVVSRQAQFAIYQPLYGENAASSWQHQIEQLATALAAAEDFPLLERADPALSAAVEADLAIIKAKLRERLEQVRTIQQNDERKLDMTWEQIAAWKADAQAVLTEQLEKFMEKRGTKRQSFSSSKKASYDLTTETIAQPIHEALAALEREAERVEQDLQARRMAQGNTNADIPDMVQVVNNFAQTALKLVSQAHKRGGKELHHKLIQRLEQHSKQRPVHYTVPLRVDDQLHQFHLAYTPAKDYTMTLSNGAHINDPLNYHGRFPCSANRSSRDAQTVVCAEVHDSQGQLVRREVRSGTFVPYLLKNRRLRHEITQQRCLQSIHMMAAANLDRLPDLDAALCDNDPNGQREPVPLKTTYVCYLSPDQLRKSGIHENEFRMANESKKMLEKLSIEPQTLTFGEGSNARSAKVKLEAKMFVFPINMLGFFPSVAKTIKTFELADQLNLQALHTLLGETDQADGNPGGEVGEWLSSPVAQSLPIQQRNELIVLCKELRTLIQNKLYHEGGERPFYGPWLVDQITNRLGQGLINGCKSAKDRTNNANKAINADSCVAHVRSQQNPEGSIWHNLRLGKETTSSDMVEHHSTFHLLGGGFRQQKDSCGLSGYKVDPSARGMVDPELYNRTRV